MKSAAEARDVCILPLSRRLALHLLHISVDWNTDDDVRERPWRGQCRAIVAVVQSKVGLLWTKFPAAAQLQWCPQHVGVPCSNLHEKRTCKLTFFTSHLTQNGSFRSCQSLLASNEKNNTTEWKQRTQNRLKTQMRLKKKQTKKT